MDPLQVMPGALAVGLDFSDWNVVDDTMTKGLNLTTVKRPHGLSEALDRAIETDEKASDSGSHVNSRADSHADGRVTALRISGHMTGASLLTLRQRGVGLSAHLDDPSRKCVLRALEVLDLSFNRIGIDIGGVGFFVGGTQEETARGYLKALFDQPQFKHLDLIGNCVVGITLKPFFDTLSPEQLAKVIWLPESAVSSLVWTGIVCDTKRRENHPDETEDTDLSLVETVAEAHCTYHELTSKIYTRVSPSVLTEQKSQSIDWTSLATTLSTTHNLNLRLIARGLEKNLLNRKEDLGKILFEGATSKEFGDLPDTVQKIAAKQVFLKIYDEERKKNVDNPGSGSTKEAAYYLGLTEENKGNASEKETKKIKQYYEEAFQQGHFLAGRHLAFWEN